MSGIRVESDNAELAEMFGWAQRTAAESVVDDGAVGPLDVPEADAGPHRQATYRASYRAGDTHRSGYYLRDFAHQAVGAQLLGWQHHNAGMLNALLKTATAEHGGWPVWALNFDGENPLAIDYRSPQEFVREVPAIFEMVEPAHVLFRWTGDPALLEHRGFWRNTLGSFVAAHDTHRPNGVAEGSGLGIFQGAASYNEHPTAHFREAGDAFGAQMPPPCTPRRWNAPAASTGPQWTWRIRGRRWPRISVTCGAATAWTAAWSMAGPWTACLSRSGAGKPRTSCR